MRRKLSSPAMASFHCLPTRFPAAQPRITTKTTRYGGAKPTNKFYKLFQHQPTRFPRRRRSANLSPLLPTIISLFNGGVQSSNILHTYFNDQSLKLGKFFSELITAVLFFSATIAISFRHLTSR